MTAKKHITLEAVIDWRRGRAGDAGTVEAHLRTGCALCARRLAEADRLLAAAAEPLAEPPAAALSRARALFGPASEGGLAGRLRTLIAALLPPPVPALAGLRDAAPRAPASLFEAGPWLVEVRREPEGGRRQTLRVRVAGHDGSPPAPGAVARPERAGKPLGETVLDDLGAAVCRGVPVRADRLCLLLGTDRVIVGL